MTPSSEVQWLLGCLLPTCCLSSLLDAGPFWKHSPGFSPTPPAAARPSPWLAPSSSAGALGVLSAVSEGFPEPLTCLSTSAAFRVCNDSPVFIASPEFPAASPGGPVTFFIYPEGAEREFEGGWPAFERPWPRNIYVSVSLRLSAPDCPLSHGPVQPQGRRQTQSGSAQRTERLIFGERLALCRSLPF